MDFWNPTGSSLSVEANSPSNEPRYLNRAERRKKHKAKAKPKASARSRSVTEVPLIQPSYTLMMPKAPMKPWDGTINVSRRR